MAGNNLDGTEAPILFPAHFITGDDELLVHLARNPVERRQRVIGFFEGRKRGLDANVAAQPRRRLGSIVANAVNVSTGALFKAATPPTEANAK